MVDPEVKSIDWWDEFPENNFGPAMLAFSVTIGPRNEEGGDNFQVVVCNPAWLSEQIKNQAGIWPRGMLIVNDISPGHVMKTVQALSWQFRRSHNWVEFTERMNRYLLWEYEDFNNSHGVPMVP